MGGQTPAQQPLRGAVVDVGGEPQGMAYGDTERRYGRNRGQLYGRSGGHTGGTENWARVIELVQTAFRDGELSEEIILQVVVLIPKGEKDYRGIGLMEVMWKVVVEILNRRFAASITYHDALHGFRAGRGMGTATLEAKLLQELAALREEVLYVIFLDLH